MSKRAPLFAHALACVAVFSGCGDPAGASAVESGVDEVTVGATVWVSPAGDDALDGRSPRRAKRTIQAAIDGLGAGGERRGTVRLLPGLYEDTINIEGYRHLRVLGVGRDEVTVRPARTLGWNVGAYGESRRTPVRVVGSEDVTFRGVTFDFDAVRGDFVAGVLVWNSTGAFTDDAFRNMSADGYYELTAYVSAPAFSSARRALVAFTDDEFVRTGRVGVILHGWAHGEIARCAFRAEGDFGYAVEVSSQATADIHGNDVGGYRVAAATDGSASAGILIDNSFTNGEAHADKPVRVRANLLHDCGYGVSIGNAYAGLAGDVDVAVDLEANLIQGSALAAVQVTDEGRSAGSSVAVHARANLVRGEGAAGYSIFTAGDGDVRLDVDHDAIVGNDTGVMVYEDTGASAREISVRGSIIAGNTTGVRNLGPSVVDATRDWWGSADGPLDAAGADEVTARTCASAPLALRRNAVGERTGALGDVVSDGVAYCDWLRLPR